MWEAHTSPIWGCEYCAEHGMLVLWGQSSKARIFSVADPSEAPKEVLVLDHSAPGGKRATTRSSFAHCIIWVPSANATAGFCWR